MKNAASLGRGIFIVMRGKACRTGALPAPVGLI